MKIVHIMGALNPSGMERMFVSAAPFFGGSGTSTDAKHVIVSQGHDNPFAAELMQAGFSISEIQPLQTFTGLKDLARVIQRENPVVVHIHTEGGFAPAVLICRMICRKASVVRTVHNVFPTHGRKSFSRRIQSKVADRFVSRFVAPSVDVAENEQKIGRTCQIINNWVDERYIGASKRTDVDGSRPSVVMVGNSSTIKNQVLVLSLLHNEDADIYFHGSEVNASSEQLRLMDKIQDLGHFAYRGTGDPFPSLVMSDVYVMPSLREGMSVAFLEALAMGLTCVVADSPGLQWAKNLPGVICLPLGADSWNEFMNARWISTAKTVWDRSEFIDFRPQRGAEEYLKLYSSVRRRAQ